MQIPGLLDRQPNPRGMLTGDRLLHNPVTQMRRGEGLLTTQLSRS
jgi:hypothetical protein